MGFTGVSISSPETLRHRVARAIWERRPDSAGKMWPLTDEISGRQYLHNPIAAVDLSFMYADAAMSEMDAAARVSAAKPAQVQLQERDTPRSAEVSDKLGLGTDRSTDRWKNLKLAIQALDGRVR